jgi:hypothetical protein
MKRSKGKEMVVVQNNQGEEKKWKLARRGQRKNLIHPILPRHNDDIALAITLLSRRATTMAMVLAMMEVMIAMLDRIREMTVQIDDAVDHHDVVFIVVVMMVMIVEMAVVVIIVFLFAFMVADQTGQEVRAVGVGEGGGG